MVLSCFDGFIVSEGRRQVDKVLIKSKINRSFQIKKFQKFSDHFFQFFMHSIHFLALIYWVILWTFFQWLYSLAAYFFWTLKHLTSSNMTFYLKIVDQDVLMDHQQLYTSISELKQINLWYFFKGEVYAEEMAWTTC